MSKELYVGKMSYETTEYDLEKLFSVSGRVTSVHLIVDLTTGEFKGCGYVRMSTEAEAKDAIDSLDGAILLDHKITVSLARAQKMKATGGGLRGSFKKGKPGGSDNQGPSAGAAKPATSKKTADYKAGAAKAAAARPATAKPAASKPAAARPASKPASSRPASSKPAGSQARAPKAGKR